jgi:hypothetical protein
MRQIYPLDDEISITERLQQHRKTGGVYMRSYGIKKQMKPMCPACAMKVIETLKPLIPKEGMRRHEM